MNYRCHELFIAATDAGLCAITLPNESWDNFADWAKNTARTQALLEEPSRVESYALQLQEYFAGRRQTFTLPLDLFGTAFQKSVWEELQRIPYGCTVSYSDVAERIGRPKAVRAVAGAIAANPIPFVIPCHRVIGKDGRLVGYAGGLELKAELLQMECGIQV